MKVKFLLCFSLGVMTALPSFAVEALTTAKVTSMKGKYTYELLKDPAVSGLVSSSLVSEFSRNTGVSMPAELVDGRFIVASGCEPHNCGDNRAAFILDAKTPKAVLIVRKQKNDFAGNQDNIVLLPNDTWNQTLSGNEQRFPGLKKAISDL